MLVGLTTVMSANVARAEIAIEVEDFTIGFSGNVNAHYLFTICDSDTSLGAVAGQALMCAGDDPLHSVTNGLLPANLNTRIATTQMGLDIEAFFGMWAGLVANSGINAYTAIDMRQIFLRFGNGEIGTIKMGRDFGLFGLDAVLNDISLIGVGASALVASPLNTSLGGIGYGYVYADRLSQINYTTPSSWGPFSATIGVFQPYDLRTLGANSIADNVDSGSKAPGAQARVAVNFDGGFVSATFITQNISDVAVTDAQGNPDTADYQAYGGDLTAVVSFAGLKLLGYGFAAHGIGHLGLFFDSLSVDGTPRDSFGGMGQVSYTIDALTLGLNVGASYAVKNAVDPGNTVGLAARQTLGAYYKLTSNLNILFEGTRFTNAAHSGALLENYTFNLGANFGF